MRGARVVVRIIGRDRAVMRPWLNHADEELGGILSLSIDLSLGFGLDLSLSFSLSQSSSRSLSLRSSLRRSLR